MANFVFKGIQQVKALPTTPEKGVIYFVREHKNGVATNDMSIYFGSRCYGKVEATRLDKIEQDILALDGRVGDIEDALGNWVSLGKDLETVAKVVNNHESRIVTAEGNASAAVATANKAKQIAESAVTDVTAQVNAANAAKTAAEAAQTKAEAAQRAAETAETNAETAESNAKKAQTAAETAKTAAETAESNAKKAQTAAETAKNEAVAAQGAAETAKAEAVAAQEAAEAAEANAEAAESAAVTAKNEAVSAKTDAVNAKTAAETAKTAAETAKNEAVSAKTDAVNAKTAAETAKADAVSAKTDAVNAKTAAETAKNEAVKAQTGATAAKEAAIAAQGAAEAAEANAEAAQTKAEAAQKAAEDARDAALDANTSATAIANEAKNIAGSANTKAENAVTTANSAMTYVNKLKIVSGASTDNTVKEEYKLMVDNTQLGDTIKIYKDSSLVSMVLVDKDGSGKSGQFLKYTYLDNKGAEQITYVDVSLLLSQSEFKNGLQVSAAGEVSIKRHNDSENFLTVDESGLKLSGVQDAIDTAVNKVKVESTDKSINVGGEGERNFDISVNIKTLSASEQLSGNIQLQKDTNGALYGVMYYGGDDTEE